MRLSWALVHSRESDDVHRGIAILEGNIYMVMLYFHCHDILQYSPRLSYYSTSPSFMWLTISISALFIPYDHAFVLQGTS